MNEIQILLIVSVSILVVSIIVLLIALSNHKRANTIRDQVFMALIKCNDKMDGHCSLPLPIRKDISDLTKEIDSIVDVGPDDEVTDDDFLPFNHKYDKHVNDMDDDHDDNETDEKEEEEITTESEADKDEEENESESVDDEKDEAEEDESDKDNESEESEDDEEEDSDDEDDEDEESEEDSDEEKNDDDSEDDEITDDGEVESKSSKKKKSKKKDKEEDKEEEEEFEEAYIGEGFFKRPKKLKPIPRDIVAYITIEMNAIKDSNDQAMIAGYCSAKLELVDFYLNCIDTQDERYIVPHNRQYLVQMQTELNSLLKRILQVKPINKYDRIWGVL